MSFIEVKDLTFTYEGGNVALKDMNLQIDKGEFIAVMGINGAGKTTFCLCLNGTIPGTVYGDLEGEVTIEEMSTRKVPTYDIAQKLGIVLQDPESQLICNDVQSEVAFGPENLGIPFDEMKERVTWALHVTRLDGMELRRPESLSGGQKQRLAVASALSMRPDILVLDEPTAQLDPIGTDEVFTTIRDLNKKIGMTIAMTTHKSEEVSEYADRVIVLHEGEIVDQGPPSEVFSHIELMDSLPIKVPAVSRAAWHVKQKMPEITVPTNLDAGVDFFSKLLDERKIRIKPPSEKKETAKEKRDPLFEVEDISFIYPHPVHPVTALKNVSLKINEGEFVGIIGQNGAGKTTLVKLLVGLYKPTSGRITIEGEDTRQYTPGELSKKIGLVLQNPDTQLSRISVEEEVKFGPENLGLEPEEIEERTKEALTSTGISHLKDIYPFKLSFGDRRKLSVSAILAMRPKVLIFDEPTTAQDHIGRIEIMRLGQKLNQEGHTVIMITHDMDLVSEFTERTIVLGLGEVLLDGSTPEVFSQPEILKQTYIQPPQITRLSQRLGKYGLPPTLLSTDEFAKYLEVGEV